MIKFKNITGDPFLAVGTIQRKFALNGEKSLSGVLYDGDDVLNNIDKGWSLEFDGEPYVVTYFERNDNDNTLSFDAVHKFFWNMSKSVLYSETSGSHTISWYLDQIFANTGYTYALNFKPKAVSKDNWGMKTKLALFNDIISSISGEFEINGTLISIFEKVGSDLSTIVRYGFNLSDMSIENDAAGFVTYGEGFGAYEDEQNQSGPRLHTTYTSPLASVYGILQAEPVDDQRYTIESNLKDAIKAKVDASFSVSIKLSLYDLTAAGYPYKMAHVGDWLMAIDERLDFKQRIRIISVDDEFDVNGNRISYTVTAGNVGVVQRYQAANASLAAQVNNALETANKASDDANIALISANGKNTSYYVDGFDMLPTTANEGDLGWVQAGDGRVLYIYTKKADGTFYWEKRIDPEMREQIETGVDKAVSDAQKYSDKLVADNAEQVNRVLSDVQDKQVALKNEQAELDRKAQSYANQALADAKADVQKTSQELVASIQKETADRTAAVTALDTKAKDYADTAKADAISAATTADGVINKKIDETASSITRTISQNKTDIDGKISTAQTAATQALNEVSTKVSKTEYDTKTGQLQTDLNQTTATANQAKTDIVSIKQKDDSQDARMLSIETDANGTKTTVSALQTTQGQQSGAISSLQQRADGFEATVTKVNNMSIGGRNYVLDTGNPKTQQGSGLDNRDFYDSAIFAKPIKQWGVAGESYTISFDWKLAKALTTPMVLGVFFNQSPWQATYKTLPAGQTSGHISYTIKLDQGILTATSDVTGLTFRVNSQLATGNSITYSRLKFEQGNMATDWSKAPEDLESATANAQYTADNATSTINSYKTNNDGRVSSAESSIRQNAEAITTKVSQTEYNQKTGQIEGAISSINQTANTITHSVTSVQTQVNSLKQVNLVNNSQMALDYSGWHLGDPWGTAVTHDLWNNGIADNSGAMYVWHNRAKSGNWIHSDPVPVNGGQVVSASITTAMPNKPTSGTPLALYIRAYDANKAQVTSLGYNIPLSGLSATFTTFKLEGQTLASTARYVSFVLAWNVGGDISFGKPMLVLGNKVGDYVPGPYVNNDKVATQQITINGITNTVSEQGKDLSKITSRVQTAEGSISTAKNDISGLQSSHTQTANQISTEINDRKNGDTNTLTQAKNFTTSSITSSEGGMRSLINQTSDAILARVEATNMVVNSEFDPLDGTWYRIGTGAPAGAKVFEAWKPEQSGAFQDWPVVNGSRIINYSTGNWYTSTLQVASAGKAYSASIVAGRSPAPTVSTALDFRIAFWDGNRALIGTMSSGNIIDGTSYKGIQKYVVENKVAPANTRFVSVVIAHSSGNAADYITRPSLNTGEKASPYTPTYGTNASSTVLSLLKDNWSIGIADNISNITSGIVGNANSMSLISDRVIINAPQTQIKGTAWITSAMIGNGQIGTAQIGDAAITNAKVADLDVNKLTGNVSNFIQSNWNGKFASTTIDNSGMSITAGNTVTKFDSNGARYTNNSGISATYSFGKWSDSNSNATSSTGLYLGATGSDNSFINILGTNGSAALVLAGSTMDYGSNLNIMRGTLNSFVNINIRSQLHFKGNKYNSPAYIEINENTRTFNFFTGGGSQGGGNYFWFNQNVLSAGSFSSTSVLSKKNVKSVYDEDALGEIAKTQLVNFAYKNRPDQNHVSPIIDDVNEDKQFYIPKTILGQDGEYVDMYSMISMAWRAIQQLNDKIGDR